MFHQRASLREQEIPVLWREMAERMFAVLVGLFEYVGEKGQEILSGERDRKGQRRKGGAGTIHAAFEDVDEDRLLADALARRLRGQPLPTDRKELGRLYGWLLRQGFDAGKVSALFRRGGRELE